MLTYRVRLNGNHLCVAGHPLARLLRASVYTQPREPSARLTVWAATTPTDVLVEDVQWAKHSLLPGDRLEIEILESETAEPGEPIKRFGRREDAAGNVEIFCSFCGSNRDAGEKIIAGHSGNICQDCIELCNEILKDD